MTTSGGSRTKPATTVTRASSSPVPIESTLGTGSPSLATSFTVLVTRARTRPDRRLLAPPTESVSDRRRRGAPSAGQVAVAPAAAPAIVVEVAPGVAAPGVARRPGSVPAGPRRGSLGLPGRRLDWPGSSGFPRRRRGCPRRRRRAPGSRARRRCRAFQRPPAVPRAPGARTPGPSRPAAAPSMCPLMSFTRLSANWTRFGGSGE